MLFGFTKKCSYLASILWCLFLIACSSDAKKSEEVTQESKKEQPLRPISLGGGTDTLPTERQIQRYQAALESLERFKTEQGNAISPEVKRELEYKIKTTQLKIDSLMKSK